MIANDLKKWHRIRTCHHFHTSILHLQNGAMLKNYLSLAFKILKKQKVFSLINVFGLTVGITCCLMIFLFIRHETSYDNFHTKGKDIYRVVRQADFNGSGSVDDIAYLAGAYSIALRNEYPDMIKKAVRVMPDNDLFTYNHIGYNERNVLITDSDFFELFDFPLIKGDRQSVLNEPRSIVLTASSAKKYFGNEDPIGKTVQMNKDLLLKVTGIAKDPPSNSHLYFDMIVPITNFKYFDSIRNFPNNSLFVYLQLNPNVKPEQLTSRFPEFMDKYMGKYFAESGLKLGLGLEPLKDIYFKPLQFDNVKHGNKKVIYIFMSIAVLILVIACMNFMNLATARATDRSKEVGLRKVLGALRAQLTLQFLLEAFFYATLSALLALGLLQLLMPAYTHLLGYALPSFWKDPMLYVFSYIHHHRDRLSGRRLSRFTAFILFTDSITEGQNEYRQPGSILSQGPGGISIRDLRFTHHQHYDHQHANELCAEHRSWLQQGTNHAGQD